MSVGRAVAGAAKIVMRASAGGTPKASAGQKAGRAVRRAVSIKSPIIGAIAGKAIERGTAKAVDRGVAWAKQPENQAKIGSMGNKLASAAGRGATHLMGGFHGARGGNKQKSGEFDWDAPASPSSNTERFI